MKNTVNLIADCGATKCDWLIMLPGSSENLVHTAGFSPFFHTSSEIEQIISAQLLPKLDAGGVSDVWFYGTGVHNADRAEVVARAMRAVFPTAMIAVEHDLLAAARAACGTKPGIACILGTGSNSCLYDGRNIVDNVPSLGWLLGDEGSGTHLGKALLRAWFYRDLPPELQEAFEHTYQLNEHQVKDRVYGKGGNSYVAGFSGFIGQHIGHPFLQRLLTDCFDAFIDTQVLKYKGHDELPIHFVGSIAYHYRSILAACLQKKGLHMGDVLQKPIWALKAFHQIE